VLVELRELEAHGRIVDRGRERLEVGEGARAIAAGLGDLGAGAERVVTGAGVDRAVGDVEGALDLPRALQGAREADEVVGVELRSFERLAL